MYYRLHRLDSQWLIQYTAVPTTATIDRPATEINGVSCIALHRAGPAIAIIAIPTKIGGSICIFLDTLDTSSSTTTFIMRSGGSLVIPNQSTQIIVVVDGVIQEFGASYVINESLLEFYNPVLPGSELHVFYWYGKDLEKILQGYNFPLYDPSYVQYDDAGNEVYKINKVLRKWTWAPDYAPYDTIGVWEYGSKPGANDTPKKDASFIAPYYFTLDARGPGGPSKNEWEPNTEPQSFLNPKLTEFTLTDSMGGVFFNLGDTFTRELWGDSLMGILGFTWEQYNSQNVNTKNNHLSRLTNINIYDQDKWITTNSEVVATEVINYVMNRFNATQYTSQIPTSKWLPTNAGYGTGTWGYQIPGGAQQFTPNIVETTTSIEAVAEELPKKMLQSYYTIRSDIITENKYYGGNAIYGRGRGGGVKLPVIAVVNKENGDGDFYFSSGENLQFTITKPIQLNHITTSIHEPDGSVAQVGDNCCVIYKIQKQKKLDPNIFEEIISNMKKSKK